MNNNNEGIRRRRVEVLDYSKGKSRIEEVLRAEGTCVCSAQSVRMVVPYRVMIVMALLLLSMFLNLYQTEGIEVFLSLFHDAIFCQQWQVCR